jgi:Ice-binding-like/Stigma-specific protein, Stig1
VACSRHFTMKTTRGTLTLATLTALVAGACTSPDQPTATKTSSVLAQTLLGTGQAFAVLANTTVTNTGPTTVYGDVGVVRECGCGDGLGLTGFPPGLVTGGMIIGGGPVTLQAQNDVNATYVTLAGEAPTQDLTGQDLGGMRLTTGVYHFSSSAQLTGALTLDAQGDSNAVFVFQMGSTLTTASNSSVIIVNGGQDCDVFWQVGSSATLGTTTVFKGNIVALASITLNTGATVSGRALALNGAVTMDDNVVSILDCGSSEDAGVEAGGVDSGQGIDTGSGSSSGGSAESGIDSTAGDSSGGEAGIDASAADAGEAGQALCCGGALCKGTCSNLSEDVANCGSCGNACAPDQFCAAGACVLCSPVCAGACVDLSADDANCGSCGNTCLASATCTSGACVPCATLCNGACADLGSDPANCGSCGNACPASAVCTGGACVTCPELCGGACVDLGGDPANCGSCGTSCAPGESCVSGSCVCQ